MSRPLFVGGPWHGRRIFTGWPPADAVTAPPTPTVLAWTAAPDPDRSVALDQTHYELRWYRRARDPLRPPLEETGKQAVYVASGTERYGQGYSGVDRYDLALADHLLSELDYAALPACAVPDCDEKAPLLFIAAERGRLAGRDWKSGDEIRICPEHGTDIYKAQGVYGLDELAEWLRPDANFDALDAYDVATDLLYGAEIATQRARMLRLAVRP